jgi:hypothetical protein
VFFLSTTSERRFFVLNMAIEQVAHRISEEQVDAGEKKKSLKLPAGTLVSIHVETTVSNGAEFIPIGRVMLTGLTEVTHSSNSTDVRPLPFPEDAMHIFLPDSAERRRGIDAFEQAMRAYEFDAIAAGDSGIRKIDRQLGRAFLGRESLLGRVADLESVKKVVMRTATVPLLGR